jgi:hypothetical protein
VLINIGYGDTGKLFPESPRLAFEEIATIAIGIKAVVFPGTPPPRTVIGDPL